MVESNDNEQSPNEEIDDLVQDATSTDCESKESNPLMQELEECKKALVEKEEEVAKNLDLYKRALADVENIRKRSVNDKQDALKYGNFNIISDLLTVLDDMERAFASAKTDGADINAVLEGLEMIEKQFQDLLFKKYGVEKYGEAGELFDPNNHQAVMMEAGDYPDETILEVFRKGYKLHDRVIRPSQVKIGKPE